MASGKDHDVDVGVLEGAPGDLVPDQKWIVRSRRIDDRGRKAEIVVGEIKVCRLDDIGVNAFLVCSGGGQTGANISFQYVGRKRWKSVFYAEQLTKCGAELFFGETAHRIHVLLQQLHLEARHEALGQLTNVPASMR